MSVVKEKNEANQQIAHYKQKINDLKSAIKTHETIVNELRDKIGHLEKEHLEKLRMAREEEWTKIHQLEAAKADLERQVSVLKQRQSDLEQADEIYRKEVGQKQQTSWMDTNSRLLSWRIWIDRSDKMQTSESLLKESHDHLEQLIDQMEKEQQAYQHTIERQKTKYDQDRQVLEQKLQEMHKEHIQALEKVHELDQFIERQQHQFETRILTLKDKVKGYKQETAQLRQSF
ncbi:hypothetical protein EDD86DRAFT_217584 [Gorgonomyces haynaldii]|nr:hypothetical protein EDD86DRAFT_217584 [Gorgonomyces haynaldii]